MYETYREMLAFFSTDEDEDEEFAQVCLSDKYQNAKILELTCFTYTAPSHYEKIKD